MDERLGQIKEGAGLEESRINTEFVDFLKKWSTPALALLAAAALAYLGLQKLEERRQDRADAAFREYEAAAASGNPDALIRVASEFDGVGAVKAMALIDAGDVYYGAVLSGIEPGAPLTDQGEPENDEDRLTDDERETYLGRAESQYQAAFDATRTKPGHELHAISAAYGLAAIAETRAEPEQAREWYEKVFAFASKGGYAAMVEDAKERILNRNEAVVPVPLNDASAQPPAPGSEPNAALPGALTPVEGLGETPVMGPELPPIEQPAGEPTPEPDQPGADQATEPAPDEPPDPQSP